MTGCKIGPCLEDPIEPGVLNGLLGEKAQTVIRKGRLAVLDQRENQLVIAAFDQQICYRA